MDDSLLLLSIETTSLSGSVALARSGTLLAQRRLAAGQRSAQSLAPGIAALLAETSCRPTDMRLIAVATGPGSFTGLRVGVMTAKTMAYAVGAAVLGVNTLDIIARQTAAATRDVPAPASNGRTVAVMDAQRGEAFAAFYRRDAAIGCTCLEPTRIWDAAKLAATLHAGDVISGPFTPRLSAIAPSGVILAPQDLWEPQAATIAVLAWEQYCQGRRDDLWQLVPQYFRRSAAEEKLDEPLASTPRDGN